MTETALARDARRLVGWPVPQIRHRYTRHDVALYALSIGAGQDPMAVDEHRFIDPWSEHLTVLPSMALVLGYPGFWLGSPEVREATGIAPDQVLHAEQYIELHAPLPVEGEVIGKTRVAGVIDKGPGRGVLLHSERQIYHGASGALLATCRQTHFLRGAGGCGTAGEAFSLAPRRAPQCEPSIRQSRMTRPEQALLYRLNGDANRLHIDPDIARLAGFPRPILHGMCTAGVALLAATRELAEGDAGRIQSIVLRMTAPVLPGDTLVTEMWPDGSFRTRAAERDLTVIDGGRVALRQH